MKISIVITLGIVAVIAIAVIATIGGSLDQSSQSKIRVAFFPSIGHAVPIVGIENGIFEKGIGEQIKIETKLFDSGPQVIESIFASSIDVAYVGPGPVINGFLKSYGKDIRILAGAASGGASFIIQPDSGLDSIENFDGKRIASPQISNSQDVSLRYYLASNDLKPVEKGGTVFVLNISNPDIYTLFAKGDIDGAWVPEPWATMLVQDLDGVRLFNEEKLWPNEQFASVLLIARTDYLENNHELVQNWLKSHKETVAWINSNPDQSKSIFESFLKKHMGKSLPTKIIDEAFSNLTITDFKVSKVPALAQLLTLASLQGIADTLSGEGIRFESFEMKSNSKDNLLNIEESLALGPAVSIFFDGYVDKGKIVSLSGTLVPARTVNKVIGWIPLLGKILVGNKIGEGIFGVSFKMKGPPKNIKTTVNPIKTLTPRFITRMLEKIKDMKNKNEETK